jgi:peptidoglycan hydrolase CwlO-like protein
MDIQCALLVGGFSVIFVAMGYGYKIHVDRRTLKLEKQDQQQQKKIKVLEDKNGDEQHQIDDLKGECKELKGKLSKKDQKFKELKGDIRLLKALMTLSTEERIKELKKMENKQENDPDESDDE